MPSTTTVETVEAVVFGIVAVGMWIFSIFWSTSKSWSQEKNNRQRILKTITGLYGWAAFFLMTAALVLVLGAGAAVRSDGTRVEWIRWAIFIVSGTLVAITVMYFYEFERWPDMVLWTFLVGVSWAFGLGFLLTSTTKLSALFSVLGGFVLLAFGFWLFVQSRIVWYRLWDFFPAGFYILMSLLVWLFLWLGPAGGKAIPRHWEVSGYVIVWFFMIMLISVLVWIFYARRRFDLTVSSAVKSSGDKTLQALLMEEASKQQARFGRGRSPVLVAASAPSLRPATYPVHSSQVAGHRYREHAAAAAAAKYPYLFDQQ